MGKKKKMLCYSLLTVAKQAASLGIIHPDEHVIPARKVVFVRNVTCKRVRTEVGIGVGRACETTGLHTHTRTHTHAHRVGHAHACLIERDTLACYRMCSLLHVSIESVLYKMCSL